MSLELRLLPFDGDIGHVTFSHTVLNCSAILDLYDYLIVEPQMRVPDNFMSFLSLGGEQEGFHYGLTIRTPYGEPLMYVEIESLLKFIDSPIITRNRLNKATWAYLSQLPARTKVALFWH